MSLKSKRTVVSIAAGIAALIAYIIYALSGGAPGAEDLKAWAIVMIVSLGIAIGAQIVVQIVFHIAAAIGISIKERDESGKTAERIIKSEMAEDERDKQITLKASHIGYSCAGAGFVAALIALACGASAVTALHILLGAGFAATLVDAVMSIILYEKGQRG